MEHFPELSLIIQTCPTGSRPKAGDVGAKAGVYAPLVQYISDRTAVSILSFHLGAGDLSLRTVKPL